MTVLFFKRDLVGVCRFWDIPAITSACWTLDFLCTHCSASFLPFNLQYVPGKLGSRIYSTLPSCSSCFKASHTHLRVMSFDSVESTRPKKWEMCCHSEVTSGNTFHRNSAILRFRSSYCFLVRPLGIIRPPRGSFDVLSIKGIFPI
jgi:hypothetical protein